MKLSSRSKKPLSLVLCLPFLVVAACGSSGDTGDGGDGDGDGNLPGDGDGDLPGDGDGDLPGDGDGDLPGDGDGDLPGDGDGDGDGDYAGVPNVTAPASTSINTQFFKMGDLRLINNAWGAAERNCPADQHSYTIFVEEDKSFGWEFNRGTCGGAGTKPDYPEVEFGIHPFGVAKHLVTSPDYSSTAVLPLQIKDITSANVKLDNLAITLTAEGSWNLNFELWVSEDHPVTGTHSGAYAELMLFWGWQPGRWPCEVGGLHGAVVQAGDDSYTLCHQSDLWSEAPDQWRYFQFSVGNGQDAASRKSYNGTVNVKTLLDWLVENAGWSPDLWVSRMEIGSEIDDGTAGRVSMDNVHFEVNGVTKSAQIN